MLGLFSATRSLKRTGFKGFQLFTEKEHFKVEPPGTLSVYAYHQLLCCFQKRYSVVSHHGVYLTLLLLCAGDIEVNPGPSQKSCKYLKTIQI